MQNRLKRLFLYSYYVKSKGYSCMIDDLLEYNRAFVAQNGYEKYVTNKYPYT